MTGLCRERSFAWGVFALCVWSNPSAAQELTVIFDNGETRPLAEFLGPLQSTKREPLLRPGAKPHLGAADLERLLPIRSVGLTPGRVIARSLERPFARPFFLVGSDVTSQQWLARHRTQLIDIGAVGLLVEAATVEDMERMASIADGLSMTPASGSDIARALGVAHYPVALSHGRLWQ